MCLLFVLLCFFMDVFFCFLLFSCVFVFDMPLVWFASITLVIIMMVVFV